MKPIAVLRMCNPASGPLVSLNFKDGIYSISGVSKTLGQVVEENTDYSPYDPSSVVGGTGLEASSAIAFPVLTAAAVAAVTSGPGDGFTAVMTFTLALTGTGFTQVSLEIFDAAVANGWGFLAGFNGSASADLYDYDALSDPVSLSGAGAHKVAVTLTETHLAASIDGDTVVVTAAPQALTGFGISPGVISAFTVGGPAVAVIEQVDFYHTVADADLETLSA